MRGDGQLRKSELFFLHSALRAALQSSASYGVYLYVRRNIRSCAPAKERNLSRPILGRSLARSSRVRASPSSSRWNHAVCIYWLLYSCVPPGAAPRDRAPSARALQWKCPTLFHNDRRPRIKTAASSECSCIPSLLLLQFFSWSWNDCSRMHFCWAFGFPMRIESCKNNLCARNRKSGDEKSARSRRMHLYAWAFQWIFTLS